MTDPVSLLLTAIAAGLAGTVGYLSLPSAPDLDAERWFRLMLATLLRGEVEHAGGEVEEWVEAVVRWVPYHPACRHPERRFAGLPLFADAVPGERALVERLQSVEAGPAVWRAMFDEDEEALAARLDDPFELGKNYDPRTWLGTAGWDELAEWGANLSTVFPEALNRRAAATWVLVDGPEEGPDVLSALEAMCATPMRVPWNHGEPPLAQMLEDLPEGPDYRFVFVGKGRGIQSILRVLHSSQGLRDRTHAVVGLAPVFDPEWMEAHFRHHQFDIEMDHLSPYMALQWLDRSADPPGAFGQTLEDGRFPERGAQALTRDVLHSLDLGVLPHDIDAGLVARGLLALVGCWAVARTT